MNGGSGNDSLIGGVGADRLTGGSGNDTMTGGADSDWYYVDSALDVVVEAIGGGTDDRIYTSVSYTLGAGQEVERVYAYTSTAVTAVDLTGNELANYMVGNAGSNALIGGLGNDTLFGGSGDDTITGGSGVDLINGGTGSDRFVYSAIADSGVTSASRDKISDFVHLTDRIDVSAIDASAAAGGDQAFTFIGSAAFTAEGQVRAVQAGAHTVLEFNTTGASAAEMMIQLNTVTAVTLTAADLIL
jgi:Ca2+-binding RTX toxin-like protein